MLKNKLFIVLVGFLSLVIYSCGKKGADTNRRPSSTGSLRCVYELKHEPFRWHVNLFQPFAVDKRYVDKINNHNYTYFDELRLNHGILNEDSIIYQKNSNGMFIELDSILPGNYNILIYWSRYVKPSVGDTVVISGETLVTDPFPDNSWNYKTILITNVTIAADSISIIKMDSLLEPEHIPDRTIENWEFETVIYSEWDSLKISK